MKDSFSVQFCKQNMLQTYFINEIIAFLHYLVAQAKKKGENFPVRFLMSVSWGFSLAPRKNSKNSRGIRR